MDRPPFGARIDGQTTDVASLGWVTRAALQAFMGVPDATHQKVLNFFVVFG